MGKKGFHFNQSLCSGCHSCMMVCKENHHLPEGAFFRRVSSFVSENGSKPGVFHLSLACNHCMDPACVANCPVGAMYVDEEDGTVQHDDSACIGCQSCVKSCPYGAPQYRVDLNITQKCDGCYDLRAKGIEPDCVSGLADVGTEVIQLLSRLHEWPSRIRRAPRGRGGFSKQEIGRMAKKGLLR